MRTAKTLAFAILLSPLAACSGDDGATASAGGSDAERIRDTSSGPPDAGPGPLTDTPLPTDATDVSVAPDSGTAPDTGGTLPGPWVADDLSVSQHIRAIWGPGDGTFVAVGDHGAMMWFDGHTWTPLPHVTDADLRGVSGTADGDIYVVGTGGTFLRRDPAGWNVLDPGVDADLYAVHAVSAQRVYLVGDAGTARRFDGVAFTSDPVDAPVNFRSVFAPPGETPAPIAGTADGRIMKLLGGQWASTQVLGAGDAVGAIWGTSSQFLVAVGARGQILVNRGGPKWEPQTSNDVKDRDLYGVWGTSAEDVYCVGRDGVVIHYDGVKWTEMPVDGPFYATAMLRSVWGVAQGDAVSAYAVGDKGAVVRWDGTRWLDAPSGPSLALRTVVPLSAEDVVAAGEKGMLLRWRAGGGWAGIASRTEADLLGGARVGAAVWLVGDMGTLLTVDPLDRVAPRSSGTDRALHALAAGNGLVLAVGDAGTAVRLDGDVPVLEQTGTVARLRGIALLDGGTALAVGDNGVTLERAPGGGWTPRPSPTSNSLRAVTTAGGEALAVGDNGIVLRWDAGGWKKDFEAPGKFLYGVWMGDGSAVAVGWTGFVVRRSGGAWAPEESGTVNILESVAGLPGGGVIAVGHKGTVLRRP